MWPSRRYGHDNFAGRRLCACRCGSTGVDRPKGGRRRHAGPMGVSRRQDRARRDPGTGVNSRAGRRVGDFDQICVFGAIEFCLSRLRKISSSDAILCMPKVGGVAATTRPFGVEMGPSEGFAKLSNAASGCAAYRSIVRSFVRWWRSGEGRLAWGLLSGLRGRSPEVRMGQRL